MKRKLSIMTLFLLFFIVIEVPALKGDFVCLAFLSSIGIQSIATLFAISLLFLSVSTHTHNVNDVIGQVGTAFIAVVVILLPGTLVYCFDHHGMTTLLHSHPYCPFQTRSHFPFLSFHSVSDSAYSGFIFGGIIGFIAAVVHVRIRKIPKDIKMS